MVTAMRDSTLATLGLGPVLEIFRRGALPIGAAQAVEQVFGPAGERGALVISGANGIVGAGKAMQLGARLEPFGVPVVALDFPAAPDGLGRQYPGLVKAFGAEGAARIRANITALAYDGVHLPAQLALFRPRLLLEAVPEVLAIKKAHYEVFRAAFPGIEIRSVTSGFPSSQLGVGIAHPAFPHEINKVFEVVEPETSAFTRALWALGLIPIPVADHWSFVLDVLFCGLTLACLRYHEASNMPVWKIDKAVRRLLGPNPLRAHDAIGARGANFLTWSCLHHLAQAYGELFRPTASLVERKESGADWYPPSHLRPIVNWPLAAAELLLPEVAAAGGDSPEQQAPGDAGASPARWGEGAEFTSAPRGGRETSPGQRQRGSAAALWLQPQGRAEQAELEIWILGPLFQMASLLLHEKRAHLAHVNAIGELCAQFSRGILAVIRARGVDAARALVEAYHGRHPEAARSAWHPEALAAIDSPEGRQLYVNAEHDGRVGVITISRESYNWDVDAELNRAIDWLVAAGVERVIVSGDFHLASQLVGADTAEFFPALTDVEQGVRIAESWSRTARRLHDEFAVSVGVINGKRCLGGMLELLLHCHYLVAVDTASLGMPEVTLPVVPGMEGCHWPFRKAAAEHWPRLLAMLLEGRPVPAREAAGWLVDHAAALDETLATAWKLASGGDGGGPRRALAAGPLADPTRVMPALRDAASPGMETARRAILDSVRAACAAPLGEALAVQARHSGAFMTSAACLAGAIGTACKRTMSI